MKYQRHNKSGPSAIRSPMTVIPLDELDNFNKSINEAMLSIAYSAGVIGLEVTTSDVDQVIYTAMQAYHQKG